MEKPRIIAFYLPQFYPTKENDEWWRKGFTEWTNVGNAKPLFRGHYQPRVPADLGYYDLRVSEVREQQAQLAREAGIEGFCYWHYWFAGRRLLDRVFHEVVESGEPNFPFCLCWANHSWYQKTWEPNKPDKLLIEQTYPGIEDYKAHFYEMLPAFKDKRYIKVDGKLLYGLFAPLDIPDFAVLKQTWNKLAKENGLPEFHFFGFTFWYDRIEKIKKQGYDSVVFDGVRHTWDNEDLIHHIYNGVKKRLFKIPRILQYDKYYVTMLSLCRKNKTFVPCVVPNFDHSPRSAERGTIIVNHTPKKWYKLLSNVFPLLREREGLQNILFVKAWNEWGEGNYMEPDLCYGKEYIVETEKAVNDFMNQ